MTDLGTLGGSDSYAYGVNASGVAVGYSDTSGLIDHAFSYSGGTLSDLGSSLSSYSYAYGINADGEIAGVAASGSSFHAFLLSDGVWNDLGTLGGDYSEAYAISDVGVVVGYADTATESHAFSYSGSTMTDLGTLGGSSSYASAVNLSGQVVGNSYLAGDDYNHGFLYTGTGLTDLGTLGGSESWALGINAAGEIVGYADKAGNEVSDGFLYSNGTMVDVNTLLDASSTGYTIQEADWIADDGYIAATGLAPDGQDHALLLTPNSGVTGTVTLQNYEGDVTLVPVTIEIRTAGTTTVLQRQTVYLNSDGSFSFPSTLGGTFDVAAKASHWLRKKITSVAFSGGGIVSGLSFSLLNGDVNGDNTINLADLVAMAAAWRTTPGAAKWNANADLNGDGAVNLSDWLIAARNWRKTGDK
jgi:probable HAF family extracellular repeat protein